MTDKEKIRNEVERLMSELIKEKEKGFGSDADDACILELQNVLIYIDSLQEEPVSVWHNASEEPNDMSHCLIFYGCKESVGHYLHYEPVLYNKKEKVFVTSSFPHPTGYKVEQNSIDGGCVAEVYKNRRNRISISDITQWCYLCDLHNLSNVQRIVKDCKEPVSEDLEEATNNYVLNVRKGYPRVMDETDRYICNAFKAGAKWQKEQDKETIELAEDHAMLAGMEKMREQMMKDAIPANILTNQYGNKYIQSWSGLKQYDKYKNGDKVKLIIIKQEEE